MTRWARFVNKPKTYSQDLSAGPLNITTDFRSAVRIERITISASEEITESWLVKNDSAEGSNYDTIEKRGSFNNSKDGRYMPDGEYYLANGEQLNIQCTNANNVGIVYVTVHWSEA